MRTFPFIVVLPENPMTVLTASIAFVTCGRAVRVAMTCPRPQHVAAAPDGHGVRLRRLLQLVPEQACHPAFQVTQHPIAVPSRSVKHGVGVTSISFAFESSSSPLTVSRVGLRSHGGTMIPCRFVELAPHAVDANADFRERGLCSIARRRL